MSYAYDSYHRLSSRTVYGNSVTPVSTINYSYDVDDRPIQIGTMALSYDQISGRLSTTTLDRITDTRTYDSYGAVQTYTATYTPASGAAQTLYSYTLTRDLMGRISNKTEAVLGATTNWVYTYDNLGRLTVVTKNGSAYSSYTYGVNGNRTSGVTAGNAFTATFNNQDRITAYNAKTYTYNAQGDLKTAVDSTGTNTWVYDPVGRQSGYTRPDGRQVAFKYDALDQRVSTFINGSLDVEYLYESPLRIAAHVNNSGAVTKEYVYTSGDAAPDYMNYNSVRYRIIKDHLGSPRLVVKSDDGTIAQQLEYTDLGKIITNTSPGFQHYAFAGGIYDGSHQQLKFGARYYDPETGRWQSKDPILFEGGDSNLYGYVQNDPINGIDPEGLFDYSSAAGSPVSVEAERSTACFEQCLGTDLTITGATENEPHTKDGPHSRGEACDFSEKRNPGVTSNPKLSSCFNKCFPKGYGQTESSPPHVHVQTGPGRGGASGYSPVKH